MKHSVVPKITLGNLCDEYLRQHSRPKGTEYSDARNLRATREAMGDMNPANIMARKVADYTHARRCGQYGRKAKDSTIRRELSAMQAVMNWAVREGMMPTNRTFNIPKPPDDYEPKAVWIEEVDLMHFKDLLNSAATSSVSLFARLGLTYGVRRGAMMDLTFGQIDWSSETIDFNPPGRPKVRKRRPIVPITTGIGIALTEAARFNPAPADGFVLRRGTDYEFRKFCRRVGYDWVTPHVLKHTAITTMLRRGVDPADVAKLTATDLKTIYRTYRHHTVAELRSIAEEN